MPPPARKHHSRTSQGVGTIGLLPSFQDQHHEAPEAQHHGLLDEHDQRAHAEDGRTRLPVSPTTADSLLGADDGLDVAEVAPAAGIELSQADLESFVEAWREAFDEDLSIDEAAFHATRAVQWALLMAKPLPEQDESAGPNL